jgi:hypothetical protein
MAGQIGLERTPDDYVTALVEVFGSCVTFLADQPCRRILRELRSSPALGSWVRDVSWPRR